MSHRSGGLAQDLERLGCLLDRRATLTGLASLGLIGCGQPAREAASAAAQACTAAPEETAGPFPANGARDQGGARLNVLAISGVERADIRPSLTGPAVAGGVPLTLTMQLVDADNACTPLAGRAVYIWHCDALGRYSMYEVEGESWLRGLQVADADGRVTFRTVYPGAYGGRYPHIHFEVYPDRASASAAGAVQTSQLIMPAEASAAVYADAAAYPNSARNNARTTLRNDGVFRDDTEAQIASVTPRLTGDAAAGYVGEVTIGSRA